MLTLNGIPTEQYQDVVMYGDLQVDGEVVFTNCHELTWENEVLVYEGEVLTYTDSD